jgi:hypothetical protein
MEKELHSSNGIAKKIYELNLIDDKSRYHLKATRQSKTKGVENIYGRRT